MQSEVLVGLASAGVAATAVLANALTKVLSFKVQRENTKSTLETQRMLAEAQESSLRETSHGQELREQRAPVYRAVLRWSEELLGALSSMDPAHSELSKSAWHIDPAIEDGLDLYASDTVHVRFNAVRGMLIGMVKDSGFDDSPIVQWEEQGGRIVSVSITRSPPLRDWPTRGQMRDDAHEAVLDLVARIRAEVQGADHSGYFVTYRLDRE